MIANGVLRHDSLTKIWPDLEPEVLPAMLQLLHRFEIAFPLFDIHGRARNGGESLVPAMLPELPPLKDPLELFGTTPADNSASVAFQFDYLPLDFFPKLLVFVSLGLQDRETESGGVLKE